ncbi:ABC transporter ATP-binding protein [Amnibacterium endophyticum]|uniref:ABC transporter ATP-binding protein n=1 Tax=Amnibacterium endophyticum TaxID=2109337 RepID=A0ABW4LCX3_9MICO
MTTAIDQDAERRHEADGTEPLLEVSDVRKHFPGRREGILGRPGNPIKAVDGVSFSLRAGETLGLVGESGCGKSTTGRVASKLIEPTSGSIKFRGREIAQLSSRAMRPMRREMQMIFQDPYSSLNPRHTIGTVIGAPYRIQGRKPDGGIKSTVQALMERVGLNPEHYNRYPHEFSGGQRQRIGIARALALEPELIVCDEPVSALDVSVQAQVVNLLEDLQRERGIAYVFIAHDLSIVRHISDRVAVMYLGKVMEITDRDSLYEQPMHPYTHALLSAVPIPDPSIESRRERILLTGDLPSPSNPPSGCVFHTRCPKYKTELSDSQRERCRGEEPVLEDKAPGHKVYCHFPQVRTDLIDGGPGQIRTTGPKAA